MMQWLWAGLIIAALTILAVKGWPYLRAIP
jgi:hypothetical protein